MEVLYGVRAGAWCDGIVGAALLSPPSPHLQLPEISKVIGKKGTEVLYLHLSGTFVTPFALHWWKISSVSEVTQ